MQYEDINTNVIAEPFTHFYNVSDLEQMKQWKLSRYDFMLFFKTSNIIKLWLPFYDMNIYWKKHCMS